jgi:hypothetical protein
MAYVTGQRSPHGARNIYLSETKRKSIMLITKLRDRILAVTMTVFVGFGATNSAHAYSVYRSVTATPTGAVRWDQGNFGVSGQPTPTLSFFYYPDDGAARIAMPAAQCFVKVDLGNLNDPMVDTHIPVGNALIEVGAAPADNPRPFPWEITFDNNPLGHWSIAKAQIVQDPQVTSNAAAGRVAAAGFRSLATTAIAGSGVTVAHGILPNCTAE